MDTDGVKLFCGEMAKKCADNAMQIMGGNGYVGEYQVSLRFDQVAVSTARAAAWAERAAQNPLMIALPPANMARKSTRGPVRK